MSSTRITEATETIQEPKPSWTPVVFAVGLLGLVASVYAQDFMFPAEWYGYVGIVLVIGAVVSFARKGRRAFYALPRRQDEAVRGELPLESFPAPTKPE